MKTRKIQNILDKSCHGQTTRSAAKNARKSNKKTQLDSINAAKVHRMQNWRLPQEHHPSTSIRTACCASMAIPESAPIDEAEEPFVLKKGDSQHLYHDQLWKESYRYQYTPTCASLTLCHSISYLQSGRGCLNATVDFVCHSSSKSRKSTHGAEQHYRNKHSLNTLFSTGGSKLHRVAYTSLRKSLLWVFILSCGGLGRE